MATLSITVNAQQAGRAMTAFGHRDPDTGLWVNATSADLQTLIKAWVKARVIDYETTLAAEADRATRADEIW